MKFPEGKSVAMIAKEYGVGKSTVRGWALKNKVPYMHGEGIRMCYIFDEESERRFKKRKTVPGPPAGRKGRPGKL